MVDLKAACQEIMEAGQELYRKGLIVGTDGNLSARLDDGTIAITASGACKGKLTPEQICVVSRSGQLLHGPKPARDIRMHLAVYRERPEAMAVVHAHPPVITGLSATRFDFERVLFPEALFNLRGICLTEYAVPISVDVSRKVTDALRANPDSRAVVLANHGVLTFAETVMEAFYALESAELVAKSTLVALLAGQPRFLTEAENRDLARLLAGVSPDSIVPPDANGL
mgnify:FL=1